MEKKKISRKDFLSYSALLGVSTLVGSSAVLSSCGKSEQAAGGEALRQAGTYYIPELPDKAIAGREIKVGLIGCGGRGTGALNDALQAADGVKVVALGDVFADKIEGVRRWLKDSYGQEVADDKCFVGFDAYKKVIDAGIDYVICTTPPTFRAREFEYATKQGVNSFLEKPIAVDAEGYRKVIASARQAVANGLVVVTGTQRHHERSYVEGFKKVQEGMIGNIVSGAVYWNQGQLWYRNREAGWSDMEWMIRDWVNWKWLSGDHIVEQHVHNIDVFLWMTGMKPIKATAQGSRNHRVTGDQFDQFSVDFEFENGVRLHSVSRQINGCSNCIGEFIQGTKGSWSAMNNEHVIKDLQGNVLWKYDFEAEEANWKQRNPYCLEHVDLINHIRKGTSHVEAEDCAISCLAGIMGREAAYTGATVTWDEISGAQMNFIPEKLELGDVDMSQYKVPVPGKK
ncbi:MAG: Gfo/Idh/MocA family oxidoreductase [Alistipes sp.]|nr:Gfo/Idh/MocA family oxidoreductase [Alistipes sp.]